MNNITYLTIDRRIWLRGEGGPGSYLLREDDQKMCCMGIFLEACGISRKDLSGKEIPLCLIQTPNIPGNITGWVLSSHGYEAMELNDARDMSEDERESHISNIFKHHDIEVEFIN